MIGDIPGGPGRAVSLVEDLPTKRVVLQDKDGLRVILGRAEGQPESLLVVQRGGQEVGFSLVKVKRGYYLYKEIVPPRTGKLGDFHPSQV